MLENTLNIKKKLEVLALHIIPLVQLYYTLKKITLKLHSIDTLLSCLLNAT